MARLKLVLLPGLDGTGVLFQPLLRALPAAIEPIVISYPDHEKLGYDALLPRVMSRLPQDGDFVVLGESFGGPLALRISAARPSGLRALILSASFVSCPYPFVPGWATHLVRSLPFHVLPHYAWIKARLGGYSTPELAALSARTLSQVAPEVFAHRLKEVVRVNVVSELRECTQPLLYIQGTRDRLVPGFNLQRVRAIKPDIECVHLPAPHMVLQEQAAMAASAIENFIARHGLHDMRNSTQS